MTLNLRLEIPLHPTENFDKVEKCIRNLIGKQENINEEEVEGEQYKLLVVENIAKEKLKPFFERIRREKILDAVRNCAIIKLNPSMVEFLFHKQALYMGVYAVITEDTSSPLGNVVLQIKTDKPHKFLDWLTPKTIDGKVIVKTEFQEIENFS